MCGRYTLLCELPEVAQHFGPIARMCATGTKRFNIAPTQSVPVIVNAQGARSIEFFRWGIKSKGPHAPLLINARSESVADKPTFRNLFKKQRCLIPASGFYEWQKSPRKSTPYYLRGESNVLAMAGIWDSIQEGDGTVYSFCILTQEATPELRAIHHRMPVFLQSHDYAAWLDPSTPPSSLLDILKRAGCALRFHPVRTTVNSSTEQGQDLILPYKEPEDPQGGFNF